MFRTEQSVSTKPPAPPSVRQQFVRRQTPMDSSWETRVTLHSSGKDGVKEPDCSHQSQEC